MNKKTTQEKFDFNASWRVTKSQAKWVEKEARKLGKVSGASFIREIIESFRSGTFVLPIKK